MTPRHLAGTHEVTLTHDVTLHAGAHPVTVPAGTRVRVRTTTWESGRRTVYVYAPGRSGRYRVTGAVYRHVLQG